MTLNRIPCPECGAGLKSPSGFKVGQNVCCPKCETYFTVEEPPEEDEEVEEKEISKNKQASTSSSKSKTAGKKPLKTAAIRDDEDEDQDRPKKKKKKRRDDDSERSYHNSPLRFAILGVLVVVMLVLGYFLYDKYKNKRDADDDFVKVIEPKTSSSAPQLQPVQPKGPGGQRPKQGGPVNIPANPVGPNQPKQNGPPGPGGLLDPTPLTEAEKKKLLEKYKAQLIGTWRADLGGGVTVQLVYGADGKASATLTTPDKTETFPTVWTPNGEVSRKGLTVIAFAGTKFAGDNKPMKLIFEDDELQHPVLDPVLGQMVIAVFRKT